MKTLLVTGHKGLLGSACVRRLSSKYQILTFDGNILDQGLFNTWLKWHKPDSIIHCAAKVGGVKSNRDFPVDFISENLKIQEVVIGQAHREGINNLVFVGTSCLFPKDAPVPVSEDSLLTGPFESSVQAYAIAKLAGYAMCKAYATQYGRNYMTVCPSNIFGPGDNYGESAHVIPALMRKFRHSIKTKDRLVVWGDGSAIREFIYADDAADAIGVVLEKWNRPDVINIGTGEGCSIAELVYTLRQVTGGADKTGEIVWDKSQPTGIHNKTFDITRLKSLGWGPKVTFREGLDRTWRDFINNPYRCK